MRAQHFVTFPVANPGNPSADDYCYVLITAGNVMSWVPECGESLRGHAWTKGQPAMQTSQDSAHQWRTAHTEAPQAENAIMPSQQTPAICQAQALGLRANQATVRTGVDPPIVPAGDLDAMQTLVAARSAGGTTPSDVPPPVRPRLRRRS